jgi:hypothetical protein
MRQSRTVCSKTRSFQWGRTRCSHRARSMHAILHFLIQDGHRAMCLSVFNKSFGVSMYFIIHSSYYQFNRIVST